MTTMLYSVEAVVAMEARVKELEGVFRHTHVRRQYPDEGGNPDACAGCGLDLRDAVHRRVEVEGED